MLGFRVICAVKEHHSMESTNSRNMPCKRIALWRGAWGYCPNCGMGHLFKSYLKQNSSCLSCSEDLSSFRADDGPAWLTILLTCHIVVPIAVSFAVYDILPEWVELGFLLVLTVAAALLILPRAKGLFISALWLLAIKKKNTSLTA